MGGSSLESESQGGESRSIPLLTASDIGSVNSDSSTVIASTESNETVGSQPQHVAIVDQVDFLLWNVLT